MAEMSEFLTELDVRLRDNKIWVLDSPLVYESNLIGKIEVPSGFETDFASVPRLPVIYVLWGDRAHREAVVHDYLYRIDSIPLVLFSMANRVFLEAMETREKDWFVRWPMFLGVRFGGHSSYHKRKVGDSL